MSKSYFTKFLPVEGEIKEGDKYSFGNRILTMTKEIIEKEKSYLDMSDEELDNLDITEGRRIKHKLFLCSRDVKIEDYLKEANVYIIHNGSEPPLKVIGEILTPEILENQEFTEKETEYLTIGK